MKCPKCRIDKYSIFSDNFISIGRDKTVGGMGSLGYLICICKDCFEEDFKDMKVVTSLELSEYAAHINVRGGNDSNI